MIKAGLARKIERRSSGSYARIRGAKHQSRNACLNEGRSAHGAGFQRDIERATEKPVILQTITASAKRQDLGVSRRIMQLNRAIIGLRYWFPG